MITSIFIILGILSAAFIILGSVVDVSDPRKLILFFGIFITIAGVGLAYLTEPYYGSDLSRYFAEIGRYQRYGWDYAFSAYSLYASTPLTCLFMYLVSLTGDFHLFPAISAGITLVLWNYVLWDQSKYFGWSNKAYFSVVLFVFGGMNGILSILIGGRQHLAFALMLFALWYDLKPTQHKKRNSIIKIALYLPPILIHYGVSPIYIARVCVPLYRKLRLNPFASVILALFIALASNSALELLVNHSVGGILIEEIYSKFSGYNEIAIADFRVKLLESATAALLLLLTYLTLKQDDVSRSNDYLLVLLIISGMSVAFFSNYHLSDRLLSFCLYGSYPIALTLLSKRRASKLFLGIYAVLLIILTLNIAYEYVSISNQWQLTWV